MLPGYTRAVAVNVAFGKIPAMPLESETHRLLEICFLKGASALTGGIILVHGNALPPGLLPPFPPPWSVSLSLFFKEQNDRLSYFSEAD